MTNSNKKPSREFEKLKLGEHLCGIYRNKEEQFSKIMSTKGEVRGVVFQTDAQYIRAHKGESGLNAVEEEIKKMGYTIDYDKIRAMKWYPIGLRPLSLLAAKKALDWNTPQIVDMGRSAPKYSLITKLILKYFASLKKVAEKAPMYWRKHWSTGSLDPGEVHEDEKYLILRLRDFKVHPILCTYLTGYYLGVGEMTMGGKNQTAKEVKCMHRGDEYHEFIVRWE